MTRDSPAEILVSARRQNGRDSMFFLAHRVDFLKNLWDIRRDYTLELISFKSRKKSPLDCSGNFFLFLRDLFTIFQWFRQLIKIAVTSVTFRRLEMARDP